MNNATLYAHKMQHSFEHFCNMLKHRGEILKKVITEQGVKISQIARKLNINRGTVYRHMDDPDLSIEHIMKYGEALGVDFSDYFPEMIYIVKDTPKRYGETKSYDELKRDAEYWKDKYIDLLEKYNALMAAHLGGSNGASGNSA